MFLKYIIVIFYSLLHFINYLKFNNYYQDLNNLFNWNFETLTNILWTPTIICITYRLIINILASVFISDIQYISYYYYVRPDKSCTMIKIQFNIISDRAVLNF